MRRTGKRRRTAGAKDGPFCDGCAHWQQHRVGDLPLERSLFGRCLLVEHPMRCWRWTFDEACALKEVNPSSREKP